MCKHSSWGKALIFSVSIVLLLCLLSSGLLFSTHGRTASATGSIFYDFVDQAPSASWAEAKIEIAAVAELPDLIVSRIECGPGNKLSVTIKNIGSGALPSGWQAVAEAYFNQMKKGTFNLKYPTSTTGGGIEEPGGSSTYLIAWDITAPVIVMVMADSTNAITESNEQNNYKEEVVEPLLPDLIVSRIECSPSNKLSVTIKNIGSGDLPDGWTATAKTYFDGEEKGFFGLTSPTSTSGGGIEKAGGSSTYLLAWDITAPVTVMVMADSANAITESNEQNNYKEEEVVPLVVKLPDLVITEIEYDQQAGSVSCTIKNTGEEDALPSFVASLSLSDPFVYEESEVEATLKAGETYALDFKSSVQPVGQTVTIQVCADTLNQVQESNEQNNCLEETWYLEEELPDLIIVEIKCVTDNNRIGYVLKNTGEAAASAGHATVLLVDGEAVCEDIVDLELAAGERHESWFDAYTWPECETIEVEVCSDYHAAVEESNEQNNCLEKICECIADITPPQIISGPTVSQISQTSVLICWETDEVSASLVKYDCLSGKYGSVIEDPSSVKEHRLSLTNLEPSTTYHFMIESTDSSDNQVRSRDLNFETLSPPDYEKPSLSLPIPDTLSGRVPISVDTQDNIGVDRVVFFIDGEPMHTDYSSPFEWECDTKFFEDGIHNFGTQSFDFAGNMAEKILEGYVLNRFPDDLSPVIVSIFSPANRSEVYGEISISVEIRHVNDLRISYIEVIVDDVDDEDDEEIIYPYHFEPPIDVTPLLASFQFSCLWDTSGVELGEYNIRVRAQDEVGNWGFDGIMVEVIDLPTPSITVSPHVRKSDNYFEIIITVENNSDVDITNITISDTHVGFQCIGNAFTRSVDWGDFYPKQCTVVTDTATYWQSTLQASLGMLQSRKTKVLKYYVVPILVSRPGVTPMIGYESTISFQARGRDYSEPFSLHWSDTSDRRSALRDADYLIVTNPQALFIKYVIDDVNELLSTMAELAKEKQGVLGYLPSTASANFLKNLIRDPLGSWWEELDGFEYLLIVGETEIVPAFNFVPYRDIALSDNSYADTYNNDGKPELRVGRIIGNSATELMVPIITSLNVLRGTLTFDREYAVVVTGGGVPWELQYLETHGDLLISILRDSQGIPERNIDTVYTGRYNDATECELMDHIGHAVKEGVKDRDIITYSGHGGPGSWFLTLDAFISGVCTRETHMYTEYGFNPLDLGTHAPVVLAGGCLTGYYEGSLAYPEGGFYYEGTEGESGIAEAFLRKGAAVYIGATRGIGASAEEFQRQFLERYWIGPHSVGEAFVLLKCGTIEAAAIDNEEWKRVAYIYNLYGDPKFGGS